MARVGCIIYLVDVDGRDVLVLLPWLLQLGQPQPQSVGDVDRLHVVRSEYEEER